MAFDFSKAKPILLDDNQAKALEAKLHTQENRVSRPVATEDSIKLWKTPINDRALVYIPNFTRVDEAGNTVFDAERAFVYPIRTNSEYLQLRDTTGLTGLNDQGISGNSPLREIEQENWEIYNAKLNAQASKLGVDPKSDSLKDFRSSLLSNFSVKPSNEYLYFPIIHIETSKAQDGNSSVQLTDALKKDGQPVLTPYVFRISKRQFDKLFANIASTLAVGDTLGGHLYQFSYITGKATSDLKEPARDSGLAFVPTMMQTPLDDATKASMDAIADFIKVENLRNKVYELMLLPDEVHAEIAKEAHARIEDELKLVRLQATAIETSEDNAQLGAGQVQGTDQSTTAVDNIMANLGAGQPTQEQPTQPNNGVSFG